MDYIKELYIDEKLKEPDKVLALIKRKENVFNVYLICVDRNGHNFADIMSTYEAFAERNNEKDITVIGIAYGRRGAYMLFQSIIGEYLEEGFKLDEFKNKILQ